MSNEWLAAVKPGDEVAINAGYSGYSMLIVDRVTSTQIICGKARYRRDTGRLVGGSGYRVHYLSEPTPAIRETIERNKLLAELHRMKWEELETERLRRVVDAAKSTTQETSSAPTEHAIHGGRIMTLRECMEAEEPSADVTERGREWYRKHGHGHITPRDDGALAKCGGPAICKVCALEQTALNRGVICK